MSGFGVPGKRNFGIAELELAEFTDVIFLNKYDNRNTGLDIQGNCDEALYVHTLVLGADAYVTVDNCRVYYGEIINYGAEIEFVGCGDITEIVLPADPDNVVRPDPWMYTEYGGICNDDSDCWGPAPTVAYCVLMVSIWMTLVTLLGVTAK